MRDEVHSKGSTGTEEKVKERGTWAMFIKMDKKKKGLKKELD